MGGTLLLGVAVSYLFDGHDHPLEDFKQPSAGGWGSGPSLLFELIHPVTGATGCEMGLMAASRSAHAPELLLPPSLSLQ